MPLAQGQRWKKTVKEWWDQCGTTVPPELWHDPTLPSRPLSPHAQPWRPWKPADTTDPCRREWNNLPTRVPWSDPGARNGDHGTAPRGTPDE